MNSFNSRKMLLPQHLILLALALTVSFRDAQATDMEVVRKYAETDSIKVIYMESNPTVSTHSTNIFERITQTLEVGDEIEMTVRDESATHRNPISEQTMKRLELESKHVSQQRMLAKERLSRASENIQRGELSAHSKYYRDLLNSYKELDEKYQNLQAQMKPGAESKPIKKVLTVLSKEQILKEFKANHSENKMILMLRRISFKDIAKGASGFIVAAGATAQAMAAEQAEKKAETAAYVVKPKPYQGAR